MHKNAVFVRMQLSVISLFLANIIVPSLWIGTSTGSIAVIALSLPSNGEQRLVQPVIATNTGVVHYPAFSLFCS